MKKIGRFLSSKGNQNGNDYSANLVLKDIVLEEDGDYEISVWIIMYGQTGCNDDKYSISITVHDSNDNDLSNKIYFYKQSDYLKPKWIEKKASFNFTNRLGKATNEKLKV